MQWRRPDIRVLLLAVLPAAAAASTERFHCECGQSSCPTFSLDLGKDEVILHLDENPLRLAPLVRQDDLVFYSAQKPGDDDERVITSRQLRFSMTDGSLVYFQHEPAYRLVEAVCRRPG